MTEAILSEIEDFLRDTGMKPYRFGYLAVRNGRLVDRLREGRPIQMDTAMRIREFMKAARKAAKRSTVAA